MTETIRSLVVASLLATPFTSGAQAADSAARASKTFFTKRDLVYSGVTLVGSAAVSHFDRRIAHWSQTADVQGSSSREDVMDALTKINELPLTLAALGTYALGRVAHSNTITDVGLHASEAMLLTVAVSEVIRIPVGRKRPHAAPDDQYKFEFGGGLSKFEDRSFPSLHASAAFAAASAIVGEMRLRNPGAARYAAPALYAAAMVPGLTRIYLDQHWASDVAAGAALGALLGSRVVTYAHSHDKNWLDRMLSSTTVVPGPNGTMLVMVTTQH
jgi:membrane-associated phospholipid phosphatase